MKSNLAMNKGSKSEQNNRDYTQEYLELFAALGVKPENMNHEWEKEGDVLKQFSLYDNVPTPILTTGTFPITTNNA